VRVCRLILILALASCLAVSGKVLIRKVAAAAGGTDYTADANCIFAYLMNDGSTDETDDSGNGITGTQTSGTIPTSSTVPSGYSGTSRDFELTESEYLYNSSVGGLSGDSEFTVAAWIRMESTSSDVGLVHFWETSGGAYFQWDFDTGTDGMELKLSTDGYNVATTAYPDTGSMSASTWYHVAVTWDGSTIRWYLNGSADGTDSFSGSFTTGNAKLYVGDEYSGLGFDGLIDEVILFDRELSSSEISDIYTDGIDGSKGAND